MRGRLLLAFSLATACAAAPALAGPPYVTDDPEPEDPGHLAVRTFVSGTTLAGETAGQTGLDIDYGAAKDLQLTLLAPLDFDSQRPDAVGVGDVELSVKYRFLHQSAGSWLPDVSVFPQINLPTAGGRFGDGRASYFLPVWAEKDWGPWSAFGGGGYTINPGPGNRNSWLVGWALTRQVTDKLLLGGEIFHQTSVAVGQPSTTMANLGVIYQLNPRITLLASGGPSLQAGGGGDFYAALEFNY